MWYNQIKINNNNVSLFYGKYPHGDSEKEWFSWYFVYEDINFMVH